MLSQIGRIAALRIIGNSANRMSATLRCQLPVESDEWPRTMILMLQEQENHRKSLAFLSDHVSVCQGMYVSVALDASNVAKTV